MTTNGATIAKRPSGARGVVAATLGNALEWFDLVIYSSFAPIIGKVFFPAHDPAISLLIALGTFGGSYLIRPLGAVVIGSYADRVGRKSALLVTTALMMAGTGMIVAAPGYATIGIAAPAIIIAARLIQGFSAGGEFASATAFLAEQNPDRRAFYSSWQFASQGLTMLLAAGFGAGLSFLLTPVQLYQWGWRVPFAFGLLIGPAALYIRRSVQESPQFTEITPDIAPLKDAFFNQKINMILALGSVILATVAMYTLLYMPTYAAVTLQIDGASPFTANIAVGVGLVVLTPIAGLLADKMGCVAVALPAAAVLVFLPLPLFFWLTKSPSAMALLFAESLLAIPVAFYLGAIPALLTDLFPARVRTTGMSLSYNLAVMLFGGFAPFFITWAIATLGFRPAPGLYLALAASLSLVTLTIVQRRRVR